jgi:DNA polymerase-3 subunit delta
VYLFIGEEEYLRDAKIAKVVESALTEPERAFNLDVRNAGDVTGEDVETLFGTPPLMASRRVVIMRDVSSLRKGARESLERYLRSPQEDVLLIMCAGATLAKADTPLADKATLVEFRRLKRDDTEKWIEHHAAAALGARISPEAVSLLADAVGDDLAQLASELDKLASYSGPAEIDATAVEELVGVRRGQTLADLLDAVVARDAARAVSVLPQLLAQPRTSGVSVLLGLSTQMMAMAYARALLDAGESTSRLQQHLFAFLGAFRSALTGRPWGEAVRVWARAVQAWNAADLDHACELLLRTDMQLKESRTSSDEQILATLVLELCASETPVASR